MNDQKKTLIGLGIAAMSLVASTGTASASTGKATANSRTVQDGTPVRTRLNGFSPPGAGGGGGVPSYCGIGFLQGSFRAFDEYARIIDDAGFWAVESKSNPIDGVLNAGPSLEMVCKSLDEFGIPIADYGQIRRDER